MFKNILCPIDMQPRSKMALKKAIYIAHQFNSNITLLNIHEEFLNKKEMVMSRLSTSLLSDEFRKIAIDAKKDMKDLIHNLEADDIHCDYVLREGHAENQDEANYVMMQMTSEQIQHIVSLYEV